MPLLLYRVLIIRVRLRYIIRTTNGFYGYRTGQSLDKMAAVVAHGRRKGQLKSTGNYISLVYVAFPCLSKNASNGSVQECVRMYAKVVHKDPTHLYAAAWLGK